jgi:DNA-directed RNA polymerase, mitochondrial
MFTEELLEAQRSLEQRAMAEGYARYEKEQASATQNEGAYATKEATKVIRGCLPLVSQEITAWLTANDNKGRGKTHVSVKVLNRFDSDTLAFIALNQTFVGVTSNYSAPKVATHIGTVIENEVIALDLQADQDRKVAERIRQQVAKQGSAKNRTKAFKKLVKDKVEHREPWPNDYKVRIGEPLISCVLRALPNLFELRTLTLGRSDRQTVIQLTSEGVELVTSVKESIAWNAPVHRPMVVMPRPWESFHTGCYYDERNARSVKLVRTFNPEHRKLINKAVRDGSLAHVLEAVNHAQSVAWAINQPILAVVERCWKEGIIVPGLPTSTIVPLPPRLPQEQFEAMTDFERKGHRIHIAQLREKNRGIAADKAVMDRDLDTAKELTRYERFYLPHNLDFRGRVYPVCHFSHQRTDYVKAMFRFADGCPYGEFGGAWASVHLANCGDYGKVSKQGFAARLQWVADNEDLILRTAADPFDTRAPEAGRLRELPVVEGCLPSVGPVVGASPSAFWTGADKPFSFLAACFEYAAWVDAGRSPEFVGYLPVALDGSNSGLQHYSAALRARDEAGYVSLLPAEEPEDLYERVAESVRGAVSRDAAEGDALAALALANGVGRNLVKRNVMTFAYSSAQYGFRQQLLDDTMGPLNDAVLMGRAESNPWECEREDGTMDGGFAATGYLSKRIYQAVTQTVRKATEGMDFFRQVAGVLAAHNKPLTFTSPVGLPVVHKYAQWETKAVKLFLYDRSLPVTEAKSHDKLTEDGEGVIRRVEANIRTRPLDTLDKDKARSAVSPNVIHAMDASHLMLVVLDAKDAGIDSLALIHDSFGTHAGRTAEFSQLIRQAFVNMYENYCPFETVLEAAKEALPEEAHKLLPTVPEKGDLDLQEILDADYAFA